MFRFATLILVSLLLGLPSGASATTRDGVTLHRFATTETSWGVNAYWLESGEGIVLIDSLFLRPDAEILVTVLKSRRRPLRGVVLTHPHVDHFGGLGVLRKHFPKVPVYATATSAASVQEVHDKAFADGWIQAYGAAYDPVAVTPDRVLEADSELELAGMHFRIKSYGPAESADNLVVYNRELDVLFTGDLVMNGSMYFLGEGRSKDALATLERVQADWSPALRALPAHGDPGDLAAMLAFDAAQVRFMRTQVQEAADRPKAVLPEGRFSDPARARLLGIFTEHFRGYLDYGLGVEMISRMNLGGLETEILAERGARAQR